MRQVKSQEGLEDGQMLGRIGARGDVHDDKPVYAGLIRESELHGHLATEGMAKDMSAVHLARVEKIGDVTGHERERHVVAVRGEAVVAQVHEKDASVLREFWGDAQPVIG